MFRLFRKLEPKEQCVLAADPADGGSDFCAAVLKSKKHADSPMVYHAHNDSAQFGYELHKFARYVYGQTGLWPTIGVERNVGMATIHVLQQLNYAKLFRMKLIAERPGKSKDMFDDKIGWVTDLRTRPMMLDDLSLALKQQATRIYDPETVEELRKFIRNQRSGKPEAGPGAKDDLVICEAIAWQMYQIVPADQGTSSLEALSRQFPQQQLLDKYGNPTI